MPGACSSLVLLGAYYYTWYGIGEQWQVFPRPFEPTMGEYRSADAAVMQQHHAWAKEACIDFFAVSWGGDGTRSPKGDPGGAMGTCSLVDAHGVHSRPVCHDAGGAEIEAERGKEYRVEGWQQPMQWWTPSGDVDRDLMRHLELKDGVPMALMYEVRDVLGVGEGQGRVDLSYGDNPKILEHHLMYAAEHYFKHPNYLRVDGSPVLFLYTMRDFDNFIEPLGNAIRQVEEHIGQKLFIIGDMIWWSPSPDQFPWRDWAAINVSAVTGYNLYCDAKDQEMSGAFAWHSANLHSAVAAEANLHGMQVVPYVSPGYDDRKMRGGSRPAISRALGAQYLFAWKQMLWFLKCQSSGVGGRRPILMLNSFNEWHEGTQVEPSREFGSSYLHWTRLLKGSYEEGAATRGLDRWEKMRCSAKEGEGWEACMDDASSPESYWQEAMLLSEHHWLPDIARSHAARLADRPPHQADPLRPKSVPPQSQSEQHKAAKTASTWMQDNKIRVSGCIGAITWLSIACGFFFCASRKRTTQQIVLVGLASILFTYLVLTVLWFWLAPSFASPNTDLHASDPASATKKAGPVTMDKDVRPAADDALGKELADLHAQTAQAAWQQLDAWCGSLHLPPDKMQKYAQLIERPPFPPGVEQVHSWPQ